jgi:predicted ATP-grasp superfamily ATP-dependent carboligase
LILETGFARGALAGARGLREAGCRVGVGSPVAGLSARSRAVSEWHRVPPVEAGKEQFVEAVRDTVRARGYDVVFAAGDAELLVISEERERLGATIPHPPHPVLLLGLDKLDLMRAASDAGLHVPKTSEANAETLPELDGPVIVKPRLRLGTDKPGRRLGARVATTAEEARAHIAQIEAAGGKALLQERVSGSLIAWIGVLDDRSRVLVEVQQAARRLWPPGGGVSASAVTVPVSPTISQSAQNLLERLSWSGLVELQFIVAPDGRAQLIDLNPRFYGSLALAIGAGANLPAVWAAAAMGCDPVPGKARAGERYHWLPADLRALLAEPTRRVPADVVGVLRWAVGAHHSVWSVRDPAPGAWYAAQLLRGSVDRAIHRRGRGERRT